MAKISISIKAVEQGSAAVKFIFLIIKTGTGSLFKESATYAIGNFADVRFKFEIGSSSMLMKLLTMKRWRDDSAVKMCVTCENMIPSAPRSWFCTEEWVEKRLGQKYDSASQENIHAYSFAVNIIANNVTLMGAPLYNDKNFTDCYLTAEDGSVGVHKVALATHSDMFKTMLGGEWNKFAERCVEVEGVTLQTLQHLKDYMYLGTLPSDGLRPLLLLAKRYLIENLERDCILKLAQTVKPEALLDLLDFARENHIPELTFAVLQHTSDTTVRSACKMLEEKKERERKMVGGGKGGWDSKDEDK